MERNVLSVTMLLILNVGVVEAGNVYKCKSLDGLIQYSQSTCPENDKGSVLTIRNSSADRPVEGDSEGGEGEDVSTKEVNQVITEAQLQGIWTDFKNNKVFASTWVFSKPYMIFKKYNGSKLKAKYTLKDNVLIVHHEPNAFTKQAWDEEMEIIRYTGDTLTWIYGINVTLHRLH